MAIAFLVPLASLPLAAIMLGERITALVLWAGPAGAVILFWPQLAMPETDPAVMAGIATGPAYVPVLAFLRIHIKTMTTTETPAAIAFWFSPAGAGLIILAALMAVRGSGRGGAA